MIEELKKKFEGLREGCFPLPKGPLLPPPFPPLPVVKWSNAPGCRCTIDKEGVEVEDGDNQPIKYKGPEVQYCYHLVGEGGGSARVLPSHSSLGRRLPWTVGM